MGRESRSTGSAPELSSYSLPHGSRLRIDGDAPGARVVARLGLEPSRRDGEPLCILRSDFNRHERTRDYPATNGSFSRDGSWLGAVTVDFSQLAPGCTLEIRPDTEPAEVLPWINALLPETGLVPLHASGFRLDGCNVVFSGFAHSGKTGVLLAAASAGGSVIGDDCLWLSTEGQVHGLDVPAEVQLRYLDEFPEYRRRLPAAAHRKARSFQALASGVRLAWPRLADKLDNRARVRVELDRLFEERVGEGRVDAIFLSIPHAEDRYSIEPVSNEAAARQLCELVMAEYRPILELHAEYRYRFPDRHCAWLEGLESRLAKELPGCLATARAHVIRHPYPARAGRMLDAIRRTIR